VLTYYETNYKKASTDPDAAKKLKQLLGIVPNMSELARGLRKREAKENVVYKIVLDVLGAYLKDNE
jgi:hypothetical protein